MNREELLGVTYSEFDNKVGPQLRFQYPLNVLSADAFETLSDYVIVGKHLCEKVIIIKTDEIQFLNYSVAIDNIKYERNALLFAVGCVLKKDVDTEPFEPVLRKLSASLIALEIEREYLFQYQQKRQLENVLQTLFEQLVIRGEAFLRLDEANFLSVALFRAPQEPSMVLDSNVPQILQGGSELIQLPWDISLQHLLPWIDGVRSVRNIAREAMMDVDCVRRCLQTLLFCGFIIVADPVRFSNCYQCTPAVHDLVQSPEALHELCSHSRLRDGQTLRPAPSPADVLRLLLSLWPGSVLVEVLSQNHEVLRTVDIQRLLPLAQFRGYIKRCASVPSERSPLTAPLGLSSHRRPLEVTSTTTTEIDSRIFVPAMDSEDTVPVPVPTVLPSPTPPDVTSSSKPRRQIAASQNPPRPLRRGSSTGIGIVASSPHPTVPTFLSSSPPSNPFMIASAKVGAHSSLASRGQNTFRSEKMSSRNPVISGSGSGSGSMITFKGMYIGSGAVTSSPGQPNLAVRKANKAAIARLL